MPSKQKGAAAVLLVLLAATVYGIVRTNVVSPTRAAIPLAADSSVVDQSSLITVQELVRLPTMPEEVGLAQDAFRVADQEMDLAFADAVREAAAKPRISTPEIQSISQRLQRAQEGLAADQAEAASLTAAVAKAGPTTMDNLTDELNLTKAHVALHQDEVDDARQDLIVAGGDPQGRMEAIVAEHDASSRSSDSTRIAATAPPVARGLIHRAELWWDLRQKAGVVHKAQSAAEAKGSAFATQHATLEKKASLATNDHQDEATTGLTHEASAALLRTTEQRANENKTRSSLDQHVENQQRLAAVYAKWGDVLEDARQAQINRMLRGVAGILLILLFAVLLDKWIEHSLGTLSMDSRRLQTLMMVVRVSIQFVSALFILLVIFGPPSNIGTFLGLAGAGLTVALKDFIIGFIGWFVLMGNAGIRIGDMVEINGVTGEVVALGMFHTVLHETGSWTDAGHPTGRRVTFTNSFAIEGHYFNFSTSGQWLWDEVRVVVPAGRDPYPIAETMKAQVEEATAESARAAEQHWKGSRKSPHFTALSAVPSVHIKPISGGIEITVRYITHATELDDVRANLYRTAVDLLGAVHVAPPVKQRVAVPAPSA
jgi:small-conductance mechanosensitive channel